MNSIRLPLTLLLATATLCACKPPAPTPNPAGLWHATVKNPSGESVAFSLDIKNTANHLTADLINGTERLPASSVYFAEQLLTIRFDFYDGTLQAQFQPNQLTGTFTRQWEKQTLTRLFQAQLTPPPLAPATDLTGDWLLNVGTPPNQRLWRAAFQTSNNNANGTIITSGGDWGQMHGTFTANTLTLNHFDGINSRLLRLTSQPDGTLTGEVDLGLSDPKRPVLAQRITDKNKELVATLPDPATYTRIKNPTQPFRFSYPDLNGKTIAWDDPQFKNKVLIISITGSWCPNCHEETPFMQSLYQKYKTQGLEVIALAFEYSGNTTRDQQQLRLFAQRHAVTFPLLLAGTTEDAPQKLDQLTNFSAFPTTIFIGRDGLVKSTHAGFEGPATGIRFTQLKSQLESQLQQLLTQ